ncbi:chorismate synthase [Actinomyces vulturis]|uniref:chorismate synthase n=1 Tax=Actinomyces vulturis TaxID=1857645 RepID=UPI000835673F|nr:chorismate synthase [Actinomyces vulturis]
MLRWMTAGESHGPALTAMIDGLPAGLELTSERIERDLAQRRQGYGRGARQAFERDVLTITGGLRHGKTLGSPLSFHIANSEWPKWTAVMSPDPVDPALLRKDAGTGDEREIARNKKLTRPRPGHADLAGMMKYDVDDARNILERASARETASRVVVGTVASEILRQVAGIELVSHVVSIGDVELPVDTPLPSADMNEALNAHPVRCCDEVTGQAMMDLIDRTKQEGNTLGGVVEVIAYNVPVGLGSHTQWDRRLDSQLAAAVMSIQSVKGVEIGDAWRQAHVPGTQAHDPITSIYSGTIERSSNYAGGVEGGMSNGAPLRVRAALKPISTVPRALESVDLDTGQSTVGLHQRSDVCAVVPAAFIAQSMVALTLAQALLEKTGGDSIVECRRNLEAYLEHVDERTTW